MPAELARPKPRRTTHHFNRQRRRHPTPELTRQDALSGALTVVGQIASRLPDKDQQLFWHDLAEACLVGQSPPAAAST